MTSKLTQILNRVLLIRVYTKVQGMALFPGQNTMWFPNTHKAILLLQCHKAMCNGSNTTEWNGNGMEECNGTLKNLYSCVLCVGSIRPLAYRILRMLLIHLWFIRLFLPLHFTHIIQLSLYCVCVVVVVVVVVYL